MLRFVPNSAFGFCSLQNSFLTPKFLKPGKEIEPSQLTTTPTTQPPTKHIQWHHHPGEQSSSIQEFIRSSVLTLQVVRSPSVHSSDRPRSSVHSSTYTVVCIESVFNGVSFVLNQCSYDTCLKAKCQSNSPQKTAASLDAATKSRRVAELVEPTCTSCPTIHAYPTKRWTTSAETQARSTSAKMPTCSAYERLQHASCWINNSNLQPTLQPTRRQLATLHMPSPRR